MPKIFRYLIFGSVLCALIYSAPAVASGAFSPDTALVMLPRHTMEIPCYTLRSYHNADSYPAPRNLPNHLFSTRSRRSYWPGYALIV